jgi:hypothetical protein
MEIQVKDLTTKAMLVSLNISQWNINRKSQTATEALTNSFGSDAGWARGNKSIADKKDLAAVTTLITKMRAFHTTQTLPWNDQDNQRILPSKNYMYYTTEMRLMIDEAWKEVNKLDIDTIKENARVALEKNLALGQVSLYNQLDYPADNYALRDKFGFKVQVMPIPNSADFRISQITDEDIKAIQKQIEDQIVDAQKGMMKDLFNRLYKVVESANEAFKDPNAGFHTSKIDNIGEVIEVLRRLNMDDDPKLERLCKIAEERVCTLDPKELKADINARKQAADTTSALLAIMDGYN